MKKLLFSFAVTALTAVLPSLVSADTTTVNLATGSQTLYSNAMLTNALTPGVPATAGDGAIIELGYYSLATTSNNFAGTFIPLSGPTSSDTYLNTSIGDDPVDSGATQGAAGTFALALSFTPSTATGNNLPAAGTPLAVLFYNGTTLANSTKYNVVSDDVWLWIAPSATTSQVFISLDDDNLEWLGGPASAFYTSLPVPEPSTGGWMAAGVGACFFLYRRRRKLAGF